MRRVWKEIGPALLLGGLLPSLMVNASALLVREKPKELPITVTTAPQTETTLDIRLRQADDTVEEMGLEAYLTGVLLGEVPADFEPEALKAQAVAARTYTAKAVLTGGKHGNGFPSPTTAPGRKRPSGKTARRRCWRCWKIWAVRRRNLLCAL